jgi:hypothetical protein
MHKSILIVIILLNSIIINAQAAITETDNHIALVSFSTGINNPTAIIGMNGCMNFGNKYLIGAGLGLGTAGIKANVNAFYFFGKNCLGNAVGLSLHRTSGYHVNESTYGSNDGFKFDFELFTAYSLNMMYGYYGKIMRRSKVYVNAGWAIRLYNPQPELYNSKTRQTLNRSQYTNQYDFVNSLNPGGLIIATGVIFPLYGKD